MSIGKDMIMSSLGINSLTPGNVVASNPAIDKSSAAMSIPSDFKPFFVPEEGYNVAGKTVAKPKDSQKPKDSSKPHEPTMAELNAEIAKLTKKIDRQAEDIKKHEAASEKRMINQVTADVVKHLDPEDKKNLKRIKDIRADADKGGCSAGSVACRTKDGVVHIKNEKLYKDPVAAGADIGHEIVDTGDVKQGNKPHHDGKYPEGKARKWEENYMKKHGRAPEFDWGILDARAVQKIEHELHPDSYSAPEEYDNVPTKNPEGSPKTKGRT